MANDAHPYQTAGMSADRGRLPCAVITEREVLHARDGGRLVQVPRGAIVTQAARDRARECGVKLVEAAGLERSQARPNPRESLRLLIGSDHGGFELKEWLRDRLQQAGYPVRDVGTFSADSVDYPDFAHAVAEGVARGMADRGIIVDGAGVGSCMVANKVPGVLAAFCPDEATAINSREHNCANVLTLGSRGREPESVWGVVKVWLGTEFGGGRHARRVEKIFELEARHAAEFPRIRRGSVQDSRG